MGLCCATALATSIPAAAQEWEPFPTAEIVNDFGQVGVIQTPSARMAPEGQVYFGGSHVWPYDRFFVTLQATNWLEASLRYTSIGNRLYSPVPEFSGDQSNKDRGLDFKLTLLSEGQTRPALAVGARDILGTGLFSAEYFVLSKRIGDFDLSGGIGWGNLATRGHFDNPLRAISSKFDDRGSFTPGGGTLNSGYFKGRKVALFGGVNYQTPLKGLTAQIEYDPNDYTREPLGNNFDIKFPLNMGLNYAAGSWLQVGASFERGNRFGFRAVLSTNFNRRVKSPKIDPPAPSLTAVATPARPVEADAAAAPAGIANSEHGSDRPRLTTAVEAAPSGGADVDKRKLATALSLQGAGLYAADFQPGRATLYVAQTRYRNMATGLGRISRAAFSVLPAQYVAVTVVLVENGVETMSATLYRDALEKALDLGSSDELFVRTEFDSPPLALGDANYRPESKPGFFYAIRPGLRTTLGRPEKFVLYQLWLRLHGALEVSRGLSVVGSLGVNVSDNFEKLRIPSDSTLPRVRSDIKEYLREGRTAITHLQADYNFNIAPSLYGHVYGGLLEEMFGGVGGEVLYRPYDSNWALGAELTYAKQRDYDQWFSFRDYEVLTGHVTAAYHFETMEMDAMVKAGRYLAKDWGATFQLSRTFKSGISVGAFATFTDVPARDFGEGRFDKGLFLTIPLDILYVRNVRSGVGILWRPLIRDGGQMVVIRRPLLSTTESATMFGMRRDWRDILE